MSKYWQCLQCNNWFKNPVKTAICDTCWFTNHFKESQQRQFDRLNCIHIYEVSKDDSYCFQFKCKECDKEITYYKWSWRLSPLEIRA